MTQPPNQEAIDWPFSVRNKIRDAIADPTFVIGDRKTGNTIGGEWIEDHAHWQARAVIKVMQEMGIVLDRSLQRKGMQEDGK